MACETGLLLAKRVVLEQRVEDGLGDEVLGEHLDDLAIGDAVVQVVAQLLGEGVERRDLLRVRRVRDDLR